MACAASAGLGRAALLLTLVTGVCRGAPAPVSITVHDSVRLESRMVRLADVADVEAEDAALAQRFGNTQLLMLGQRGQPVRLTQDRIRYALNKRLPGLQDAYRLGGAPAVQLTWWGRALDGTALLAWAESTLAALPEMRAPNADVRISAYPLSASTPLFVPPGHVEYVLRKVQPGLAEHMNVTVDVVVDGAVALSVPVRLWLQGSRIAWRVRQDAQAGAALDAAMLETATVPLSQEHLANIDPQAMAGTRLKLPKAAGSLLLATDLDRKKPVERGSEVVVRIVRGGLAVEDRALALNEAVHGAQVRVVNPRTQASYVATVTGDGTAEVK